MDAPRPQLLALAALAALVVPAALAPLATDVSAGDRPAGLAAILLRRKAGCTYGGQSYEPGEVINSIEPCLNCTCHPATLSISCHLRVCPTYSVPPPPGCFLVTRSGSCCSELICDTDINVIRRSERRQEDSISNMQNTTQNSDIPVEDAGEPGSCTIDGTVYAGGSAMMTSSSCEYCFCIRGKQQCVQPRCTLTEDGCQPRYRSLDTCCPTDYDCTSTETTTTTTSTTTTTEKPSRDCEVRGRTHAEGSRIVDLNSPCRSCFCLRGHVRCAPVQCSPPLLGCAPIMEAGKCCPVSYNCSVPEASLPSHAPVAVEIPTSRSASSVPGTHTSTYGYAEGGDRSPASPRALEHMEGTASRPNSFARSASGGVASIGRGSVVAVDYGSVFPVPSTHQPHQPSPATSPARPATTIFQVHVKSGGIKVSGPGLRAHTQQYLPGLLTVDHLEANSNLVGTRRRQLRAEDGGVATELPAHVRLAVGAPSVATSGGVQQAPVSRGETRPGQEGSVGPEGSGDGMAAFVVAEQPVSFTGAFAGFAGQTIPIFADSEDERRIENALAAAEAEQELGGEGSGAVNDYSQPDITVTNIMKAVLSEIESQHRVVDSLAYAGKLIPADDRNPEGSVAVVPVATENTDDTLNHETYAKADTSTDGYTPVVETETTDNEAVTENVRSSPLAAQKMPLRDEIIKDMKAENPDSSATEVVELENVEPEIDELFEEDGSGASAMPEEDGSEAGTTLEDTEHDISIMPEDTGFEVGTMPEDTGSEAGTMPEDSGSEAGTMPEDSGSEAGTMPEDSGSEVDPMPEDTALQAEPMPDESQSTTPEVATSSPDSSAMQENHTQRNNGSKADPVSKSTAPMVDAAPESTELKTGTMVGSTESSTGPMSEGTASKDNPLPENAEPQASQTTDHTESDVGSTSTSVGSDVDSKSSGSNIPEEAEKVEVRTEEKNASKMGASSTTVKPPPADDDKSPMQQKTTKEESVTARPKPSSTTSVRPSTRRPGGFGFWAVLDLLKRRRQRPPSTRPPSRVAEPAVHSAGRVPTHPPAFSPELTSGAEATNGLPKGASKPGSGGTETEKSAVGGSIAPDHSPEDGTPTATSSSIADEPSTADTATTESGRRGTPAAAAATSQPDPRTVAPLASGTAEPAAEAVTSALESTPAAASAATTTAAPDTTTALAPEPTTPKERLALDVLEHAGLERHELPPALPNLSIIPFVAADAVVNRHPDQLAAEEISNRYGLSAVDSPQQLITDTDECQIESRRYANGELVYSPEEPCLLCRCYYGQVLCQMKQCPPVAAHCRPVDWLSSCCPQLACDHEHGAELGEIQGPTFQAVEDIYQMEATARPVYTPPEATRPVYTSETARLEHTSPETARPAYTPPETARPVYTPPETARPVYTPPETTRRSIIPPKSTRKPLGGSRIRPKPAHLPQTPPLSTTESAPRASAASADQRLSPRPQTRPIPPPPSVSLDSLAFTRGGLDSIPASVPDALVGNKPPRRPILPLFRRPDRLKYRPRPRPRPRPYPGLRPRPRPGQITAAPPPPSTKSTPPSTKSTTPSTKSTPPSTKSTAPPSKSTPPPPSSSRVPLPPPSRSTPPPLLPSEPPIETNGLSTGSGPYSLFGALKLSGCNIFGRMYRLNTVVRELSDGCTLCECTPTGVRCSLPRC